MADSNSVDVYLEIGSKRTFAGAVEWPGWSRSGPSENEAVTLLAEYGRRYADVLGKAGIRVAVPPDASGFVIGERVVGNATTDFGAPAIPPSADLQPIDDPGVRRLSRILEAVWAEFDRVAAGAAGVMLRTGPRGGGRDLHKMVEHVIGAEEAYLNALGARAPKAGPDLAVRWSELRPVELVAIAARARGEAPPNPSQTKKLWPPSYFVRRAAWHALDHLWEIEDRAVSGE